MASIGSAVAKTYSTYMTARFFQGLGVSPASTVGMAVINDLFFDYERGQKLGLWVLAIDMGLLVGPLSTFSIAESSVARTLMSISIKKKSVDSSPLKISTG